MSELRNYVTSISPRPLSRMCLGSQLLGAQEILLIAMKKCKVLPPVKFWPIRLGTRHSQPRMVHRSALGSGGQAGAFYFALGIASGAERRSWRVLCWRTLRLLRLIL